MRVMGAGKTVDSVRHGHERKNKLERLRRLRRNCAHGVSASFNNRPHLVTGTLDTTCRHCCLVLRHCLAAKQDRGRSGSVW